MRKHEASLSIQVLPQIKEGGGVLTIIDKVIRYIQSTGLDYFVAPYETTIEGPFDTLCDVLKECQLICIREGAPEVYSYIKMVYNPGNKVLSSGSKVDQYH